MSDDTPKFETVAIDGRVLTATTSIGPSAFIFVQSNGQQCLVIRPDGTIEIGAGFTPTEAGKAAIEAMRHQLAFILDAEREACAKIADAEISASESCDLEADHNATARNIAAAIRARKGTP